MVISTTVPPRSTEYTTGSPALTVFKASSRSLLERSSFPLALTILSGHFNPAFVPSNGTAEIR